MEGASFAAKLIESLNTNTKTENVNVIMGPDSHVCTFAKEIDVLLLGADRVSSEGDVSNKMGSLAAALGVKTLSKADVVVVSESDKIARPGGIRDHKEEDNDAEEVVSAWPQDVRRQLDTVVGDRLAFRNIYFEWIPKQFINTYVTEEGVLDADRIRAISEMKGRLEDELFDSSITNSAS
jgi:translation initiation factor 2B subunit (eIF-2B alpha/beta/delta family)